MAMIDVGIVIPSHNSAEFLPPTIQSICAQTCTNWTCVIVDDCSSDHSREIAKSFCDGDPRFSLLCLEENRGTSAARNAGLAALARGVRYVIFLDSDDLWSPSSLQVLVEAIERNPTWVAVHGNCRLVNHDGTYVHGSDAETASRETFDYRNHRLVPLVGAAETTFCQLLFRNPVVSPGCVLIRTDTIVKITEKSLALFDTSMTYAEDFDAWLRIVRAGRFGHLDEIVLDYRRHSSNKSSRGWMMASNMRKVRFKALSDPAMADRDFYEACAGLRAFRRYRVRSELRSAASYLYLGQMRAGSRLIGSAVVSAFDILSVLIFQFSRWARIVALDGGPNVSEGEMR